MPYPIEFGLIFRTPQMINSLKNIISKETQCALRYDSLNGTLYIDEKGKEAKCKTVHIAGFNDLLKQGGDYCAFRMPDSKAAHCVFLDSANKDGILKKPEAIVFIKKGLACYALVCEMKSDEYKYDEITEKMKSANCIIEYLGAILNQFYGIGIGGLQVKIRYLLFSTNVNRLQKQQLSRRDNTDLGQKVKPLLCSIRHELGSLL